MAKSNGIIQQLKDNEKPFGLMSEEMQEKANEIGCTEFDYYGTCVWESYLAGDFYNDQACRLRSDYAEEPEIVECEIEPFKGELMYLSSSGVWTKVSHAPNKPDFIGFKFEDGVVHPFPVKYEYKDKTRGHLATQYIIERDGCKVLHATHVLFRRQQ